ncbi:DUF6538 domain-containing protein [Rhodovulum strictum]|uniref:DUF6538 domain-containing protein n=1 Tax=Rhodovulum strictum TaxID=58314 RepID=A0A844BCG8_9RHOB|nr:DUF6538 domain-containing protein [Rhodovulum strictum]MRH20308.1 hypothetical protein [Rhodovulum strictum]
MLEHKTPNHTFWKNGVFYFRRRVPSDLSHHYTSGQGRVANAVEILWRHAPGM